MRYKTEEEIPALLRSFEDASIARGARKHAEHLVVALCYMDRHDLAAATDLMRKGIFNLLVHGFKVDLTKEMPYHETLTVFWMRTVAGFTAERRGTTLVERANELVELYDKDYPLTFYSRDHLFSDEARAAFVEPDLASFSQPAIADSL